jgi:hypothetical protein
LFFQLKCSHLVPAKAPLPEEAVFKRNQEAVERRQAARKEQHNEKEIDKCDRNDYRIKHRKAGEHNDSSDEDLSLPPVWSEDEPSIAIDWSDMSRSPSPSPPGSGGELVAVARAGHSREGCRLELAVGGPSHQR